MSRKLSCVVLAGVWALAMAATAAGPGPIGPIVPGPFGPYGDAVQVEGVITAVDGAVLTVATLDGSTQVLVTDSTVIWIGEEIVTPDALAIDMTVVVCGSLDDAGVLVAERINVKYVGQQETVLEPLDSRLSGRSGLRSAPLLEGCASHKTLFNATRGAVHVEAEATWVSRECIMSTVAHHELRAILAKIAEEVTHAYPEGEFELHLHARGAVHGKRLNGGAEEVLAGLIEFCVHFPGAAIKYAPMHPYGMLSNIVCTCEGNPCPCQTRCHRMSERPRAMLLLIQNGGKAVLVGRRAPPCLHDGMHAMEFVHQQLPDRSLHAASDQT